MKSVEYMSAGEMRREIIKGRELLAFAKCPNCDGSGATAVQVAEGEWEAEQCQWCDERKALIGEGD